MFRKVVAGVLYTLRTSSDIKYEGHIEIEKNVKDEELLILIYRLIEGNTAAYM